MTEDETAQGGLPYRERAQGEETACRVISMGRRRVRFGCGHRSHAVFALDLFGETYRVSEALLKKRERCGACELAHVRANLCRCAICGGAILPGKPVCLYPYHPSKRVEIVVIDREGDPYMVGCLRMDCAADTPAVPSYWIGSGLICVRSERDGFLGRVRVTTLVSSV